jgi:hypothetical protein
MSKVVECRRSRVEAIAGRGVEGSPKGCRVPVSLPGVELNTEYSSANVGVHPLRFSKLELLSLGVWKVGLGNCPEVGVREGVGG